MTSHILLRNSQIGTLQTKVEQVGSTLSQAELALVKKKINQHIDTPFVSALELRIIDELGSPQGIRPRKENVWNPYIKTVRSAIEKLPATEQAIGRAILRRIEEQCGHLSKVVIDVPAIKHQMPDYGGYHQMTDQQRRRYDDEITKRDSEIDKRYKALDQKIKSARDEVERCFMGAASSAQAQN
jgi:hypothetical protein